MRLRPHERRSDIALIREVTTDHGSEFYQNTRNEVRSRMCLDWGGLGTLGQVFDRLVVPCVVGWFMQLVEGV